MRAVIGWICTGLLLFSSQPSSADFDNEILYEFRGEYPNGDVFGSATVGVGDVDGDGIGDFVIGDSGYDEPGQLNTGRAYLFLPRRDPLRFERIVLEGPLDRSLYGKEIDRIGDVDGDGHADFVVTSENQHQVEFFFGAESWPYYTKVTVPAPANVRTMRAIGLGDFDGDGYDDVLVLSIQPDRLYYLSQSTGYTFSDLRRVPNEIAGVGALAFGRVHPLGDIDLDGRPDFVATGHSTASGSYEDYALLYRGNRAPMSQAQPSAVLKLTGTVGWDLFDVSPTRDLDGDGHPEFLTTVKYQDVVHRAFAISYREPGILTQVKAYSDLMMEKPIYPKVLGNFDQDGDGIDDVLVLGGNTEGGTHVYRGDPPGTEVVGSERLPSTNVRPMNLRTQDVDAVGDVDGDGFDDFLMGVGIDDYYRAGSVLLLRGGVTKVLHIRAERLTLQAGDTGWLSILAHFESNQPVVPTVVRGLELHMRSADEGAVEILDVVSARDDLWYSNWNLESPRFDISAAGSEGLNIGSEETELFRIQVRAGPHGGQRVLDLVSAVAYSNPDVPTWVQVEDGLVVVSQATGAPSDPRAGAWVKAIPSPTNGGSTLRLSPGATGPVSLRIIDLRGREVWSRSVELTGFAPVDFRWDMTDAGGRFVASGVYTVVASGRNWRTSTKVTVVK